MTLFLQIRKPSFRIYKSTSQVTELVTTGWGGDRPRCSGLFPPHLPASLILQAIQGITQVAGSYHHPISEIKFRRPSIPREPPPHNFATQKQKAFKIPPTTKFQKMLSRPELKHLEFLSEKPKIQPNENMLLPIITF